jgi:hypothetical protein
MPKTKVVTNPRPSYYLSQAVTILTRRPVPGRFDVFELRPGGESVFICHIGKRDALQELLKRGVPTPDAERLAWEIGA